jgi:hypothetical protein
MHDILNNEVFRADYERMRSVSLNPQKHSAANGYEHSEMVRERVIDLAEQNKCTAEQTELLANLARVHDIGKIRGAANPEISVELLARYGISDAQFVQLVKYHDVSLPWYVSTERGQTPSDRAWRKLANRVDIRLLLIFMIADRIDCPGGWKSNDPLMWFIGKTIEKGYVIEPVFVDGENLGS